MEDIKIEDQISRFLTSIDEGWISVKRKEFETNPFYNSATDQVIIVDSDYSYEPTFKFEAKSRKSVIGGTKYVPRTEVYDFRRYCLEYYNCGDYSNEDQSTYAWIGYCELEKLKKLKLKPVLPNLKMLISRDLIEDLSDYFNSSIHSKTGIIKTIREFVLIFGEEVKRLTEKDTSESKQISRLFDGLSQVVDSLLIAKYGKRLEALTRPFHSKYTLDFNIDRTELAALVFLLMQSGLLKESKENLEFCFEHFTFNKKKEQHLFSSNTNFTNVLGEIKQGKQGGKYHKLEAVMDLIQEAVLAIKNN